MPTPSPADDGFFLPGPADDPAYRNTRDLPAAEEARQFTNKLWSRYRGLADRNARTDARNHFHERFWEMYVAVALMERGIQPLKTDRCGPEFYVVIDGHRYWVEAICPGPGTGEDRVPEPDYGSVVATRTPVEKIILRYTAAFVEKQRRYATARAKGLIAPEDGYLLAMNSRRIPRAPFGGPLPYFIQAFLPIGPLAVELDRKTGEVVDSGYQYRDHLRKENSAPVSTTAFASARAAFCSAVIHSSVDCTHHYAPLGNDFNVLHNPYAALPLRTDALPWATNSFVVGEELVVVADAGIV